MYSTLIYGKRALENWGFEVLKEEEETEVKALKGFGGKVKQETVPPITKRIRHEHGTLLLPLPKSLMQLGLRMNDEVIIIPEVGTNPLSWQITIKPAKSAERS